MTKIPTSIGSLTVRGHGSTSDIGAATVSGHLSLSIDEVDELSLTVADTSGVLERTRLLDVGGSIELGPLLLEIANYTISADGVSVAARDRPSQRLKQARGYKVLREVSVAQYVARDATYWGLRAVTQPTPVLAEVTRLGPDDAEKALPATDPRRLGESSWEMQARYADALGFVRWVTAGTLYFGQPSWLVHRLPSIVLTWTGKPEGGLLTKPQCVRTTDDPDNARTVTLSMLPGAALQLLPGMAVDLRGITGFDTRYLVATVEVDLDPTSPATVTLRTPVDPVPAGFTDQPAVSTVSSAAVDPDFGRFVNAIVSQESSGSGRYEAVNESSGALGRYQVMPANVPSWSLMILGRTVTAAEFLRTPALQDQIAVGMLRRFYDASGPRGAAATWYSGKPEQQRDYRTPPTPSVGAYCDQVMARIPGSSPLLPTGYTGPGAGVASVPVPERAGARLSQDSRLRLFGPVGEGWVPYRTPWGITVDCHRLIRDRFAYACELANTRSAWVPHRIDRGLVRPNRSDPSTYSLHSWALAWDFFDTLPGQPVPGGVWGPEHAPGRSFRDAFVAAGFVAGADFHSRADYPHIEWAAAPPTSTVGRPYTPGSSGGTQT